MVLMGGKGSAAAKDLERGAEYSILLEIWMRGISKEDFSRRPAGTTPLKLLAASRMWPLELFAAAELALWIPMGPSGLIIKDLPLGWQDIDPGLRFWRCIQAIKATAIPLTPIDDEEAGERFVAIQDFLAARFGWPSPKKLAKQWLNYVNVSLQNHFSCDDSQELPTTERFRLTRELLELRLRDPLGVAVGRTIPETGTKFSAWWFCPPKSPTDVRPTWSGNYTSYSLEAWSKTILASILLTGENITNLTPEHYRWGVEYLNSLLMKRTSNLGDKFREPALQYLADKKAI
jgi:hypothetical protein